MSTRNGGAIFALVFVVGFLVAWTIFGYATLIAAFLATTGVLQVALGAYIVGSILIFASTLFIRSALNK